MDLFKTQTIVKERPHKEIALAAMQSLKDSKEVIEVQEMPDVEHATSLKELGFTKVSENIERIAKLRTSENMAALNGYTRIPKETYNKFKEALQKATEHTNEKGYKTYLTLDATLVEEYPHLPPKDVLKEMKRAKDSSIFKSFRIISVKSKEEIPDPILVGEIEDSVDFYHIAEWGEDIKLKDFERLANKDSGFSINDSMMRMFMQLNGLSA